MPSASEVPRQPDAEPQPGAETESSASLASLASDWASNAKARAEVLSVLAAAEAKLAVGSVAAMVFLGLVAVVFLLSAWGLALAGLVHGFYALGFPLWGILTTLAVVHVIAALLLWRYAMRLTNHLKFPATRRELGRSPAATRSP